MRMTMGPEARNNPRVKSDRDMCFRREDTHICVSSLLKCIMHLYLRVTIGEHFDDAQCTSYCILLYFSLAFVFAFASLY
jgi:hypothetical protein